MTEDPIEQLAERIEGDGDEGRRAAEVLRDMDRPRALDLVAYIDRLDRDVGTVGKLWAQEAQA